VHFVEQLIDLHQEVVMTNRLDIRLHKNSS
jgi:hypothetical protein